MAKDNYDRNSEGFLTKKGRTQKKVDRKSKKRDKAAGNAKTRKTKLGRRLAANKQAKLQNKINKLSGSKKKTDGKTITKKNKTDASWTKASKNAKTNKATGGASMNDLVNARKKHAKGTPAWKKIQNEINANYGVKKRH